MAFCEDADLNVPNTFPILTFRHSSETRINWEDIDEGDRKYMVQTLAILLMAYKLRKTIIEGLSNRIKITASIVQEAWSEVCIWNSYDCLVDTFSVILQEAWSGLYILGAKISTENPTMMIIQSNLRRKGRWTLWRSSLMKQIYFVEQGSGKILQKESKSYCHTKAT